jgi:hypothetical protein
MNKKYIVDLTTEEGTNLESRLRGGEMGVRKVKRIQILLKADEGWTDERIAEALDVGLSFDCLGMWVSARRICSLEPAVAGG